MVDLSELSSEEQHGNSLFGLTVCVCVDEIVVQCGKLVDFGDLRRAVERSLRIIHQESSSTIRWC